MRLLIALAALTAALSLAGTADAATRTLLTQLNDPATSCAVLAERSLLRGLGGGCQVPIGAHARVTGDSIQLLAIVASPDGVEIIRAESAGPIAEAAGIGRRLGAELLSRGAAKILEAVYG